jgi:hypothetical protein
MRVKADSGESNTGLFKEVKLNRGRPMAMAIRGRGAGLFRPSVAGFEINSGLI